MDDVTKLTGEKLSDAQKKALRTAFRKLDRNNDGRISVFEIKNVCRQLGVLLTMDEGKDIVKEADRDGNGYIEYKEYEKLIGHQLLIASYKNKQMRKAFQQFDKDGDGYITGEEIRQVFHESGIDMTDDEIGELIAEADTNGDGVISFEEFVHSVCEKDW